jgi:nucleoside-diphosphate-sugar epimerase
MSVLAITGASGFLGRTLLAAPLPAEFSELRVLVHHQRIAQPPGGGRLVSVEGNLLDPAPLRSLVAPGATVINLAYITMQEPAAGNLAASRNLLAACREAGIKRLIHCSTAVVAGSAPEDVITEDTPCRPVTDYERAKYRVEREMRDGAAGNHEIAILRPTVVFGPGGRNLMSQARRIARGSRLANLLYSALQGDRRMNLVSVHNVVAALLFLAASGREVDQQTYIVSDDAHRSNNYRGVARILGRELGRERVVSGYALPPVFLKATLKARGRTNLNPRRVYADDKLRAAGFVKPRAFEAALAEFARWVRHDSADKADARP